MMTRVKNGLAVCHICSRMVGAFEICLFVSVSLSLSLSVSLSVRKIYSVMLLTVGCP